MANRYFTQFAYSLYKMPVSIGAQVSIGATGAPTLVSAPGVASITRLSVGVYRIQLQDNYVAGLFFNWSMTAPTTGAAVAGGAFVAGTHYRIVTLGTTTQAQWNTAGLPAGLIPTIGQPFTAAGVGAGTGTVQAIGSSAIAQIELTGTNSLNPVGLNKGLGGYVSIKCLNTSFAATDPANGTVMYLNFGLSNSTAT